MGSAPHQKNTEASLAQKRRDLGLLLLRDMLVAAVVVHLVNVSTMIFEADWTGLATWELASGMVAAGLLAARRWLGDAANVRVFQGFVAFCMVRWTASWWMGSPDVVYTSTVSGFAFAPFLVPIATLFGIRRRAVLGCSALVAVVAVIGVGRGALWDTAVAEWRIGPTVFAVVVLLGEYARRWMMHLDALNESERHSQALALELQAATTQHLAYRMETVNEVGGALAHELNNLLAVVQPLSAHLMTELDGELAKDASDIHESGQRAQKLGRRLLMLTRSQGVVKQPTELGAVVAATTVANQERGAWPSAVTVAVKQKPLLVDVAPDALQMVYEVLVQNALDASPDGAEIAVSVDGCADATGRGCLEVQLRVEDRGHGLDRSLGATVYEPFVSTRSEPGRGLGLTTALAVIHRAGGRLELLPRDGGGTRAQATLPIALQDGADLQVRAPVVARVDAESNDTPTLNVLLVDDEPMVLRATGRMFKRAGINVCCMDSPLDALEYLQGAEVDVVVSDVRMPAMTGPELRDAVKATVEKPPPFLFITGHIDNATARRTTIFENQILFKPFGAGELIERVRAVYRRSTEENGTRGASDSGS